MKRLLSALGSKSFSIIILKIGIGYFLFLTSLWILNLIPPAPYMPRVFLYLWIPLFLINLTISLLTRKYVYRGNFIFHIAFLLIAMGMVVGRLFHFGGGVLLVEGDVFWGDEKDYSRPPSYGFLINSPPRLSFRLDEVVPGYWRDELYFIRLDGIIRYPAETLKETATLRLNGGFRMNGAKVRIKGFGLFPEVMVEEKGMLVKKGHIRVMVFPPGSEDRIEIKNYRLYIKLLPDTLFDNGKVRNISMNLRDTPIFPVRVEHFGGEIFNGLLKKGETLRIGNLTVTFTGVKKWVEIGVVKDPGEVFVFSGFILWVAGLLLRIRYL